MKRNAIALTGGIGSGKSAVGDYLRQKGFVLIDCDKIACQVANDSQVQQKVIALLGEQFVVDGQLNRAKIRSVVFADEYLHKQYSAIFHQRIKEILIEQVAAVSGTVFVEIPLIDAFDFDWQQIWLVERALQARVESVVKRDNVSAENVLAITAKQSICSNFTVKIDNNGSLQELHRIVDNLLAANNLC